MKKLLALLILGGIVSCAQSPNQTAQQSSAFPLEHLDTNVHACDDFFQYTSGATLHMPEFRNAFGCEEGDNLKPVGEEITIW